MAEPQDSGPGSRKRREKRKERQPATAQSGHSGPPSDNENAAGGAAKTRSQQETLTSWTIVLSVCTLVLSVATIVAAFWLFATNETIKKQVGVSSAQLRAYVGTQQIIYAPRMTAEPGQPAIFQGAAIGVVWRNYGATPARDLEYWISAKWYPAESEPDFSKPSEKIPEHTFMTLGPGAENPSPALFVPAADVERAMAGNGRVFFWGEASYRDVLPDTPQRHFHFCLVVTKMPKAGNEPAAVNVYKPACNFSD
jgi:hypothetical protein